MTCTAITNALPKGKGVRVNGVTIARDTIAQEVQHHPAKTPTEAWMSAARALVIRELLLQEARRLDISGEVLTDAEGRRETDEEAAIRLLIAQEVKVPEPDADVCSRYYENNSSRFRSPDIFEAAHILIGASQADVEGYASARTEIGQVLEMLRADPSRFEELARSYSDCPSANVGGNLGQLTLDQVTPEFARAVAQLAEGSLTFDPVTTRYGFHIIRLDRRIPGRQLSFDMVESNIAAYLRESVERRAVAQYVARLASQAAIDGIALASAEALRVH
jgi:peptidyl-prolyl cis-trans isomerase C